MRQGKGYRWKALAPAMLILASLAATPPAVASDEASSNIRRAPGDSAAFTLAGSNGYSLYFKSEKRMLTIIASRRRPAQPTISPDGRMIPANTGATSQSTYVVHGVSRDPSQINADLGPAGKVSLVFRPSGKKRVTLVDLSSKDETCTGATKVVRRLGSFVGSVSFHGENGYTTAEATSVRGTVGTSPFRNCTTVRRRPAERPAKGADERRADAFFSVSGARSFSAFRDPEESRFYALAGAAIGPELFVLRSATAVARPDRFSFGADGLRAGLRPPAPFSGTATYEDPRSAPPRWRGDLSVSFPGVVLPLTGEDMAKPRLMTYPKGNS